MRINFTLFFLVLFITAQSQPLSWSPQLSSAKSSINIALNATLCNESLLDYKQVVYKNLCVITNYSLLPQLKTIEKNEAFSYLNIAVVGPSVHSAHLTIYSNPVKEMTLFSLDEISEVKRHIKIGHQ